MPKKILLLSYCFPPLSAPESFLSAKTMGSFPGFEVDVVTADLYAGAPKDDSLNEYVKKQFGRIIRVPVPNVVKVFLKNSWQAIRLPDGYVLWNRDMLKEISKLDLSLYSAIVTWSQWHSIHLVGLAIKRKYPALKWLAHFSDPWVDNIFFKTNLLFKKINTYQERNVIKRADAVFFTSSDTIELVLKKYPPHYKNKCFSIPHCFDETLYKTGLQPPKDYYIVRYIGGFYGIRSPESFFKALEFLVQRNKALFDNVRIEIIGPLRKYKNLLKKYPCINEFVSCEQSVSYIESLNLMQTANCLLIIDAPMEYSLFFPSKLVDYIGADRYIFAISPPGVTAHVLGLVGGDVVDPQDIISIANALEKVLTQRRNRRLDNRSCFSKNEIGLQMSKIITSVIFN